jgi:aminoglycoside phosphotransferase (APT) family kinase protein
MKSTSKVSLEKATLARWAQQHLGRQLINSDEITEGWYNTIHVLEFTEGERAVLKVSPPPTFNPMRYEQNIMATEVAVYHLLAQEGFYVPRVLVNCPDGDGIGHACFIMEFVEGTTWGKVRKSQLPTCYDRVDADIASHSARINKIQGKRFGRWQEDHSSSISWAKSFQIMVEDLLADARDRDVCLPWSESSLRVLFQAVQSELDVIRTPQLVLWDLHDGNVLVNPDTLELTGFIDLDRALWGDPLMEFYFRSMANASTAWNTVY